MENTKKLSLYTLVLALATLVNYSAIQCNRMVPNSKETQTSRFRILPGSRMSTALPPTEESEMGMGIGNTLEGTPEEILSGVNLNLEEGEVNTMPIVEEEGMMGIDMGMGQSREQMLERVDLGQGQ